MEAWSIPTVHSEGSANTGVGSERRKALRTPSGINMSDTSRRVKSTHDLVS